MTHLPSVRRRRSPSEWAAIVEQFDSSQLPLRAYCESVGVAVSMFYQWRNRLRAGEKEKATGFTPVAVRPLPTPAAAPCTVEICLANGRAVRLTGTEVNLAMLRAIIAVAEEGSAC